MSKRILVIQTASIGDVILATAMVETLHQAYPDALLDLLVKKGTETLFAGHPFLNRVITWDKRSGKYRYLLRIIREVRSYKYSLVINIQRFLSTGLLTAMSGAAETRGFSRNPLSLLFTRRISHQIAGNIHEINRNHSLLEGLPVSACLPPRLYPSAEDIKYVERFFTGTYYTISPASLWFTKQYPAAKWIELIHAIPPGFPVYLLGSVSDRDLCQSLISGAGHPGVKSLAGELTFLQSAALMSGARMNFTNDSAPMHLASAVDAPVTVVYCSTIPGFGFSPISTDARIVQIDFPLACRPCGLHGRKSCPEKHFRCASGVDTSKLAERLQL